MITNAWLSFKIFIYDFLFYMYGFIYHIYRAIYIHIVPISERGTYWRNRANRYIDKREDILEEQFELICRRNKNGQGRY